MLTAGGNALGRTRFDGNGGAAACVESPPPPLPSHPLPTLFLLGAKGKRETSRHGTAVFVSNAPLAAPSVLSARYPHE